MPVYEMLHFDGAMNEGVILEHVAKEVEEGKVANQVEHPRLGWGNISPIYKESYAPYLNSRAVGSYTAVLSKAAIVFRGLTMPERMGESPKRIKLVQSEGQVEYSVNSRYIDSPVFAQIMEQIKEENYLIDLWVRAQPMQTKNSYFHLSAGPFHGKSYTLDAKIETDAEQGIKSLLDSVIRSGNLPEPLYFLNDRIDYPEDDKFKPEES